jgi:predicted O-methyltransferase YrrM
MAAEMGWRITGLDVSADALRTATENVQRFGLSDRVDLRRVDPEATRRHSGTYDVVFVKTVLYVSRTPAEYAEWLRWISSVLRPGGMLINFETGRGGRILRAYRQIRRREYVDLCLYDRAIDRLYDEQFEVVEKRYFSGWSQFLAPLPPLYEMAWRVEERLALRTPGNCFVAFVLGRKRGRQ